MARITLTGLICGLLAGSTLGATLFTETFPTGVSGSTWEVMTGNQYYTIPVGDSAHVMGGAGDQSAKQVDADPYIYYMRSKSGVISTGSVGAGQKEVLTVYMWDDDQFHNGHPTGQPVSAGVMLASWGASDFFQISINSTSGPGGYGYYNWRTQLQGTFSTGVARSQGWHKFQIEVLPYTGSGDVKFYIDDVLAGTGNRNSASSGASFDQIRIGLSVKTYAPFWYDNVDLSMIPEPASILLLGLGLCGLRRRRR
jgi:hypothetical protein